MTLPNGTGEPNRGRPSLPMAKSPGAGPVAAELLMPRLRFTLAYVAAWVPVVTTYAVMIGLDGSMPVPVALSASLWSVSPGAILGLAAWRVAGMLARRSTERTRLLLLHALLAFAYALVWTGAVVLLLAWGSPSALAGFLREGVGWQVMIGLGVYAALAGASHSRIVGVRLRSEEARSARAEALRAEAELHALRAQLNPHFIFNTLHSIIALVHSRPEMAEEALQRFARLLRYVLEANRGSKDDVPLWAEWKFVEDYLELERVRFGERLRTCLELDPESTDCMIPVFTLQPLVENAIRHAVAKRVEATSLRVSSRLRGEALVLEVTDDGGGADPDFAPAGVGLRALQQRVAVRYGPEGNMRIRTAPGEGFSVQIRVPADQVVARPAGGD